MGPIRARSARSGPSGNERVEAIVRFLPTIQSLAELPADASYEDLQYVLIQLADDLAGEYENPALEPLWKELRACTAPVELSTVTWGLEDLVGEACRYVEDAVAALINEKDAGPPIAPLAVESARAVVGDETTDIVTLNHDTVVERALDAAGLPFTDGFERSVKGDSFWYPPALDRGGARVLKLHGSVNWRREIQDEQRLLRIDPDQSRSMDETRLDPHAELLAGTHNKILHYSRGHFGDLHCTFRGRGGNTEA
jgi:hypothetical protein